MLIYVNERPASEASLVSLHVPGVSGNSQAY